MMAQTVKNLPAMFNPWVGKMKYNIYIPPRQACTQVCMLSHFSHVRLFATLWTVAHQAPLSMGFSRQEYWSRVLCPPPGDLPNPGIESMSLKSPALLGRFFTTSSTWEALYT